MMTKNYRDRFNQKIAETCFVSLDLLVPQDHILRKINEYFDWNFIYDLVEDLYSQKDSRPSIDPVILFKILFLQRIENLGSVRNTCAQIEVNIAYRWFLGISLMDPVPDHSTISKNLNQRFLGTDVFDRIFDTVLERCFKCGLVDASEVYVDSTHVKANANSHKAVHALVKQEDISHKTDLDEAINEDRIKHGKKPLGEKKVKDKKLENFGYKEPKFVLSDEGLVDIKEVDIDLNQYEAKKISTTDCEAGWFNKGDHKSVFAYTVSTACDKNKYILALYLSPGNVNDSKSFYGLFDQLCFIDPEHLMADYGYKTPGIAKTLIEAGIVPILPKSRTKKQDGKIALSEFVYNEHYDCYLCPEDQVLNYSTTNRDGYREYKSDPTICSQCPRLQECTKSKKHIKQIKRSVWQEYLDQAEDARLTPEGEELYGKRKETIELVFADCKQNYGFRTTNYIGKEKMHVDANLTYSAYNLLKMVRRLDELKSR